MSSERISIFLTGATGYIGGAFLQRFLEHPKASTFDITALVRKAEKAKLLESKVPIKVVVGSLEELEKLTELVENSHVVVHTADAYGEAALKAINAGLKRRHEKLGDTPIFIHTSGAAVLADDARGEYASSTIVSDTDQAALDAIPPSAPHRTVDLLAISADTEGYARSYVVFPSLIYGIAHGPLFDAGISHNQTVATPLLSSTFLQRGHAGIVGKGANFWGVVHIDDVAEFYYLLFDVALHNPSKLGHGREGYYFIEAGEASTFELSKAIGDALVSLGRIQDAEPTVFTPEERQKYFGGDYVAFLLFANTRLRADRGRSDLGWQPKYTPEDLTKSIREDVELTLKKQEAVASG
ncbi:NAD-P-binding protein [Fomes fomentarius]|nr:NAD-P-binding protein [Fomes fomentarius]